MNEQKPISGTDTGSTSESEAVFIGEPVPVETPTPRELLPPEVQAILNKQIAPSPITPPATPAVAETSTPVFPIVPPPIVTPPVAKQVVPPIPTPPIPVATPVVTPVTPSISISTPPQVPITQTLTSPIASSPIPPILATPIVTPDLVVPVMMTPEPVNAPAPVAVEKSVPATPSKPTLSAPLATTPPAPVVLPPSAPSPKKPLSAPLSLNRLRTYKDDIEVAVRSQNLSVAKVFLAEEEHRRRNQAIAEVSEPDSPKNRLYILVASILILFAVGGFVYFRFFHTQTPVGDLRIDLPALVRSDETKLIDATNISIQGLAHQIETSLKASIVERGVREIIVGEKLNGEDELSEYHRMSPSELLDGIGANPPEGLSRSLAREYFLGSYGAKNGPAPIILLTVDDHSVAYAGMLDWEKTLVRDLSGIFPLAWTYISSEPKPTTEEPRFRFSTTSKATTTPANNMISSTTIGSFPVIAPPITAPAAAPGSRNKFTDVVIANKDVRVLHGSNLQPLILYSFLDPNTILITNDPLLISEVFRRLSIDRQLH